MGSKAACNINDSVSVKSYGAKGDGITDDTAAILAAIQAAQAQWECAFVYFPPVAAQRGYLIATPFVLPWAFKWTEFFLDAPLILFQPLIMNDYYVIHGNSASQPSQFASNLQTLIYTGGFQGAGGAAIQIHGKYTISFENLRIEWTPAGVDGILIDQSSAFISFSNVTMENDSFNLTGIMIHILGGFEYSFDQIVLSQHQNATAHTLQFEVDPMTCSSMGIAAVRNSVFVGKAVGIVFNIACGNGGPFDFENILYEDGSESFLNLEESFNTNVDGVTLKNIQMSDATANISLIHTKGLLTDDVEVHGSWGFFTPINSGDPINDLEVWSPLDVDMGQSSLYVFHGPDGIDSTMPIISHQSNSAPARAANGTHRPRFNYPIQLMKQRLAFRTRN